MLSGFIPHLLGKPDVEVESCETSQSLYFRAGVEQIQIEHAQKAASLDGRQKESISSKQILNINERQWSATHPELQRASPIDQLQRQGHGMKLIFKWFFVALLEVAEGGLPTSLPSPPQKKGRRKPNLHVGSHQGCAVVLSHLFTRLPGWLERWLGLVT